MKYFSSSVKADHVILLGLIVLGAISRLVPHPHNFTAVGAMALFGGAYLKPRWLSVAAPLAAMWLSDLILNNIFYRAYYPGGSFFGSGWVYGAVILTAVLAKPWFKKVTVSRVMGGGIAAGVLFFLITNFGVWAGPQSIYPKDISGLLLAYWAGIPFLSDPGSGHYFFLNSLAGTLVYSAFFFGVYEWVKAQSPVKEIA